MLPKSGIKTSEFWITVLNIVLMTLVSFGVINQGEADTWSALIVPVIGSIIPLIMYIISRTQVKVSSK